MVARKKTNKTKKELGENRGSFVLDNTSFDLLVSDLQDNASPSEAIIRARANFLKLKAEKDNK